MYIYILNSLGFICEQKHHNDVPACGELVETHYGHTGLFYNYAYLTNDEGLLGFKQKDNTITYYTPAQLHNELGAMFANLLAIVSDTTEQTHPILHQPITVNDKYPKITAKALFPALIHTLAVRINTPITASTSSTLSLTDTINKIVCLINVLTTHSLVKGHMVRHPIHICEKQLIKSLLTLLLADEIKSCDQDTISKMSDIIYIENTEDYAVSVPQALKKLTNPIINILNPY